MHHPTTPTFKLSGLQPNQGSESTPNSKSTEDSKTTPNTEVDEQLSLLCPSDEDNNLLSCPAPPPSVASDNSSEDPDVFGSIDDRHPPLYADSPLDNGNAFKYIAQHYINNIKFMTELRRIMDLSYDMRHGPPRHLSRQDRYLYSVRVLHALHDIKDELVFDQQDVRELHDNYRDARLEMAEPEPIDTFKGEPLPFEAGSLDLGEEFSIYDEPQYIDVFGRYFGSMDQVEAEGGQMLGGWDGPELPDSTSSSSSIKPVFKDPVAEAARVRHMQRNATSDFRAHCEAVDLLLESQVDPLVPCDELSCLIL